MLYSFNKYLPGIFCARCYSSHWETAVNQRNRNSCPQRAYILYSSWLPLLRPFLLYILLQVLADKDNDDDDIDEIFILLSIYCVSAIMLSCLHTNYVVTTHKEVIMMLIVWMRKLRLSLISTKSEIKKKCWAQDLILAFSFFKPMATTLHIFS